MDIPVYPCKAYKHCGTGKTSRLVFRNYFDEDSHFMSRTILTVSMKDDWGWYWNPKTRRWE